MKKYLALLLALVMVLALAACGGSGSTTPSASASPSASAAPSASASPDAASPSADANPYEGLKVGFCPPTLTDPWLALIAEKVGQYCEEAGMTFYATEGNANIETQIQQMENFISMGCDVIIAQPVNLDAYQTVCEKARDQGIKIVFWADDPTFDVEACYMSVDSVQGELVGQMAIAWADKAFPDAADGSIKVAWLTTQMDDRPTARARCEAMINTVLADSRFVKVFQKDNLNDTPASLDAMNECLALNKDVNVVLCFADAMAMGANSAIMADKSLDHSKIGVFAGSATDEGLQLVDQSAKDESVIRGLVTFGDGDSYFIGGADVIKGVYDGSIPLNSVFFCEHATHNTVGFESHFDPAEYSANYKGNN